MNQIFNHRRDLNKEEDNNDKIDTRKREIR